MTRVPVETTAALAAAGHRTTPNRPPGDGRSAAVPWTDPVRGPVTSIERG